ncbi:LysR family transcriptional regulator [Achromobacter aloeverae]|uniref:LysR family transcriptional regulator n=1 Tax=Achromobacter aloeverae TaxID=1750518 RepID=A0A4Q1HNZ5_9BURK|nr:LysR family transcriptional regulator [Achromobacter aloeverae]RXN92619.1 LysR family transcriptional regulator [Achromobacter aloeverae]
MDNLRRIDLNLLVTLDALLAELNVTRAAQRLFLAQPTVSVQLARLREVFDDPLLLPGPRGMRPTARALALREPLREALRVLAGTIAPPASFEPVQASVTWRIAATDYSETTVLLPLLADLRTAAPQSRVAVLELAPLRLAAQMERGEIDLGFHIWHDAETPPRLHRQFLFGERYVLAGRDGHPGLRRRPTLKQFCALEHVVVSQDGGGFHGVTDRALAERGMQRRVALSVPHFLFVAATLARTDLVAMLPERLARASAGLRLVAPPVAVQGYDMAMFWHERSHRDPAHAWLRERIAAHVREDG